MTKWLAGLAWAVVWALAGIYASASDVAAGKSLYEQNCANCHGFDGRPLMPGAPNFTRGEGLMQSDAALVLVIKAGMGEMPGFDRIIEDKDMQDLLAFVRTLQ